MLEGQCLCLLNLIFSRHHADIWGFTVDHSGVGMFVFGLVLNVVPHIQNCMTPWVRMFLCGILQSGALGAIFNPQERKTHVSPPQMLHGERSRLIWSLFVFVDCYITLVIPMKPCFYWWFFKRTINFLGSEFWSVELLFKGKMQSSNFKVAPSKDMKGTYALALSKPGQKALGSTTSGCLSCSLEN